MKHLNRKPNLYRCLLLAVSAAMAGHANADPAEVKILSSLYAKSLEQIKTMQEQLENLKATQSGLFEARDYIQAVKEEYEFVQGFNPQAELSRLTGWADDQTNLNEFAKAKDFETKFALLYGEVDKRFKEMGIDDPSKVREEVERLFREQQQLEVLLRSYRKVALELDKDASGKDLARQTASATSMMAAIQLEEKIKELEAEIERRKVAIQQAEWDQAFNKYLKGN